MPRKTSTVSRGVQEEGTLRFSGRNWTLVGIGAAAVAAGYVLLASGSTVAAPLLLVLGYVVLIPLGIIR